MWTDISAFEAYRYCIAQALFLSMYRTSAYYSQWDEEVRAKEPDWILKRCVHFYSCLCAFASDPKLSEEFRQTKLNRSLIREVK